MQHTLGPENCHVAPLQRKLQPSTGDASRKKHMGLFLVILAPDSNLIFGDISGLKVCLPGEVLIYFSVQGRAAEQGIIFRIQTPGQGIIFVQIGSMTGSIFLIFDSERTF